MVLLPSSPPEVSINRIRVIDLPGIELDDCVRGEQAYSLLSISAVCAYALAEADALAMPESMRGLPADSPSARSEIPRFVDRCLSDEREAVRAAATGIAHQVGRNLGYILLTLRRGDAVNRAARPDWSSQEWHAWAAVERIWLGGGLMSGNLGLKIVAAARNLLTETGYADAFQLEVATFPGGMALLGAARYLPQETEHAIVLDLGQTGAKRASITCESGSIVRARTFEPIPVGWEWRNDPSAARRIDGHEVLDYTTSVMCRTWEESAAAGRPAGPHIPLSIAAYVREGELSGNGIYATMNRLAQDASGLIQRALQQQCGITVHVLPIHDGTAAATLYAGAQHAAVMVIGTAIGVGFPPPSEEGLRPVSSAFRWDG